MGASSIRPKRSMIIRGCTVSVTVSEDPDEISGSSSDSCAKRSLVESEGTVGNGGSSAGCSVVFGVCVDDLVESMARVLDGFRDRARDGVFCGVIGGSMSGYTYEG